MMDIFSKVMAEENMSFPEAVVIVAKRRGIIKSEVVDLDKCRESRAAKTSVESPVTRSEDDNQSS